jgi:DnaJ-class molecular chaperone
MTDADAFTEKSSFYDILGVDTKATKKEIKMGYRRKALAWHPDKNVNNAVVAEEQFKLVARAYATLSDVEKRQDYDRWGHTDGASGGRNPFGGGGGGGGGSAFQHGEIDPNELFKAFFGSAGMGGGNVQFQSFSFGGGQPFGGGGGGINQIFQQLHRQQQQQQQQHRRNVRGSAQQVQMPGVAPTVHSFDCSFFFKLLVFCYVINFLFFS